MINICRHCWSALSTYEMPTTALANHLFLGDVPSELKDLTFIEEMLIVKRRAKCAIFHLVPDGMYFRDGTSGTARYARSFHHISIKCSGCWP